MDFKAILYTLRTPDEPERTEPRGQRGAAAVPERVLCASRAARALRQQPVPHVRGARVARHQPDARLQSGALLGKGARSDIFVIECHDY